MLTIFELNINFQIYNLLEVFDSLSLPRTAILVCKFISAYKFDIKPQITPPEPSDPPKTVTYSTSETAILFFLLII